MGVGVVVAAPKLVELICMSWSWCKIPLIISLFYLSFILFLMISDFEILKKY